MYGTCMFYNVHDFEIRKNTFFLILKKKAQPQSLLPKQKQ